MIGSRTTQVHSTATPSELLDMTPSAPESVCNIVDAVAQAVTIDDKVEAFQRYVERRPSIILRYNASKC